MKKYLAIGLIVLGIGIFSYIKIQHTEPSFINLHRGLSQAGSSLGSPEYTKNLNDLIGIVNAQNPRSALQELAERMQTNEVVFQNCHIIAHAIGRTAYQKYKDFNTALSYQDTTCSDGYLHGVIEGRFASINSYQAAIAELKTVCSKYKYADRCWHGTGHGLMFFTGNDVPKSLNLCNTYTLSRARSRCYEGVFMENFLADPDTHPTIYTDATNPFKPCIEQPEKYKGVCYFYVPIYYLGLHNNDYGAALQWCEGAEKGYVHGCTRGAGSLAMKYNINDPKYVERLCMKARADAIPSCIDGMVSYYLTFTGSFSQTSSLCTRLESSNTKTCSAAVKRNKALF